LDKGKLAPFSGTLLSDAALAKIRTEYEKQIKLLQLDLDKAKREKDLENKTSQAICGANVKLEQVKYKACSDDKDRQKKLFLDTIKSRKCPSSMWYYLSFVGGAAVAGGMCAAIPRMK
jgi:hypothetical protein